MKSNLNNLREQAIRHRVNGDSVRSIGDYLSSTGLEQHEVSDIIMHIDLLEKNNSLPKSKVKGGITPLNGFLGVAFIFFGVILFWALWGKGWVSTVPLILIFIGFNAFSKRFNTPQKRR